MTLVSSMWVGQAFLLPSLQAELEKNTAVTFREQMYFVTIHVLVWPGMFKDNYQEETKLLNVVRYRPVVQRARWGTKKQAAFNLEVNSAR
mmetsp:Transcript_115001/g.235081  ORF Transcript_115001/g.235081 Transcript_115001/m.235081 type:complete len:90 (+) Transcript_115001:497-766(+)